MEKSKEVFDKLKNIKKDFEKHGNKAEAVKQIGNEMMKNIGDQLSLFFTK
jgi:hypothetical protein